MAKKKMEGWKVAVIALAAVIGLGSIVAFSKDEEKEEDDWRGCSVATLVDGAWVESELDSEAAFEKFLNGDA